MNYSFARSLIKTNQSSIESSKNNVFSELLSRRIYLTLVQAGVYRFDITSTELSNSLLIAVVGYNSTISIPGSWIFINTGSTKSLSYQYGGALYSLTISYANSTVTLTCGNSSHKISSLFLYK